MKKIDSAYLDDISLAIIKIESFIGKMSFYEFEQDEKTQFAVFHALEIIGEAANSLSSEFISSNKDFPVKQSIELRNFLIHGYDLIRLDIVWNTIQEDLSKLKEQIELVAQNQEK